MRTWPYLTFISHAVVNNHMFFCFTHSKNLGTLWEDLGNAVEGEDEIEIGEVDCSTSRTVCSKVDIHAYPTFKIFYDGEEVAKYTGNHTGLISTLLTSSCFI